MTDSDLSAPDRELKKGAAELLLLSVACGPVDGGDEPQSLTMIGCPLYLPKCRPGVNPSSPLPV
jgi:hypothetical protein